VVIPFVIALGFALAAITVMLVQRFGHVTAYWLLASGLAAIGIVAAIAVGVKEHEEEVAEQQAEQSDTEEVVSDGDSGEGLEGHRLARLRCTGHRKRCQAARGAPASSPAP
jgi:hypothetical protein